MIISKFSGLYFFFFFIKLYIKIQTNVTIIFTFKSFVTHFFFYIIFKKKKINKSHVAIIKTEKKNNKIRFKFNSVVVQCTLNMSINVFKIKKKNFKISLYNFYNTKIKFKR